MSAFVMLTSSLKEFKVAHHSILETLDGIRQNTRDYLRAKPGLKDLEIKLLAHLGKQDKAFFSELKEFCQTLDSTVKILSFLEDDTKDMKVKALVFFDRYPAEMGDMGRGMFIADFTEFSKSVLARIELEENFLLPVLEKLSH